MRISETKLIVAMVEKDVNTVRLAAQTGISRSTISAVKNGKRCSDKTARLIAKALGVDVTELLGGGV